MPVVNRATIHSVSSLPSDVIYTILGYLPQNRLVDCLLVLPDLRSIIGKQIARRTIHFEILCGAIDGKPSETRRVFAQLRHYCTRLSLEFVYDRNFYTSRMSKQILQSLQRFRRLRHLTINNFSGKIWWRALLPLATRLRSLRIRGRAMRLDEFMEALPVNNRFEVLHFPMRACGLTDEQTLGWLKLRHLHTLKLTVDCSCGLYYPEFRDDLHETDIALMVRRLGQLKALRRFDLDYGVSTKRNVLTAQMLNESLQQLEHLSAPSLICREMEMLALPNLKTFEGVDASEFQSYVSWSYMQRDRAYEHLVE